MKTGNQGMVTVGGKSLFDRVVSIQNPSGTESPEQLLISQNHYPMGRELVLKMEKMA